ncbi:GNAT family N-acetyltransferase [Rubrivivax gelatinosus]|uniref:GNAT family N-acetyltransferase n=1 Tax=Rubrivivax gelatinosus TaxID=28068 RepID=A0ABS1DXF2_RUBGE|nr:GNAT family N-acetyltransferase [Rubrivivax gelatinosus]MBK1714756.1 GNAT family N-acetyltransferase [Rubrivivax gelatinosus]
MNAPPFLFATPRLAVRALAADEVPALQALLEANADFYLTVGGLPPGPDEAAELFAEQPPDHLGWTRHWVAGAFEPDGRLAGVLLIVADLGTPGCWHTALFLIDQPLRGSGAAAELHAAFEAWARREGARWLRLGVVVGNTRAERFWRRCGYTVLRTRPVEAADGSLRTTTAMLKCLGEAGVADYLERVPRDQPGSTLP